MSGERGAETPRRAELLELSASEGSGALLSRETHDLDLNLVRFADGRGVERHVNREVDVVMVVLSGAGVVEAGDDELAVRGGQAVVIPAGLARAIHSLPGGELVYLTVHRRRARLLPQPRPRPRPSGD